MGRARRGRKTQEGHAAPSQRGPGRWMTLDDARRVVCPAEYFPLKVRMANTHNLNDETALDLANIRNALR